MKNNTQTQKNHKCKPVDWDGRIPDSLTCGRSLLSRPAGRVPVKPDVPSGLSGLESRPTPLRSAHRQVNESGMRPPGTAM